MDEAFDIVIAEWTARKGSEHRLRVDAEQNERHEIGIVILADDALLLAENEKVTDEPLERGTMGRRFETWPLRRCEGKPG
ncbi:hypothetical protein ASE59_11145 [Sphingomonas sp. Leaf10]|nr:hypothetical protein ASE59_11145 [Sphingomonas sp. Leaf10]